MILIVLLVIVGFRIRFPLSEFLEVSRRQFQVLTCFYIFAAAVLVWSSLWWSLSEVLLMGALLLIVDLVSFFFCAWYSQNQITKECYLLVKFVVHELSLGRSLYTGFQSFFAKTDALTQQKYKYFLDSVFFPQQKSRYEPRSKDLVELHRQLQFAVDNLSQARWILATYLQFLKNRESVDRKIRAATQSIRIQWGVCGIVFSGLLMFQLHSFGWSQCRDLVVVAGGLFVIGSGFFVSLLRRFT